MNRRNTQNKDVQQPFRAIAALAFEQKTASLPASAAVQAVLLNLSFKYDSCLVHLCDLFGSGQSVSGMWHLLRRSFFLP